MMFTGTTQQQDTRFSDKEKKLMKQMKFGDCLNKRVDMSKVKLDVLRPWISKKITDILHIEDDVVVEFVYNQLEEEKFPCPKKMQINMTGFLNGRNARQFMGELWALLLSAQESESGIPAEFIQQKKDEILKREEEQKHEQRSHYRENRDTRDRDRDSDRHAVKERSGETLTQREREQQLPPSTLSAIEQVRSQLSAKSRSASAEETNLGNTAKDMHAEGGGGGGGGGGLNATFGSAPSARDRSKSPVSRTAAAEAASSKNRNRSSSRRRNSSRNRDIRDNRRQSRSPKRQDHRRRSRSRELSGRQQQSSSNRRRSRSRSKSVQKRRNTSKTKNRRSTERKSLSKSPEKRKPSPKAMSISPRRKRSTSRHSYSANNVNGHEKADAKKKQSAKGQNKPLETKRAKARSRSTDSVSSTEKRRREKFVKQQSRSRSLEKKARNSASPAPSSRSSSRSSNVSGHRGIKRRSVSRNTSLSLSPDTRKDDFELRRNKNSVQKKRHYRNNRDSSASSVDRDIGRRQNETRRRELSRRQYSPRGRSPRNRRSMSRSPRRFNRRRSPMQHFRGRGGNNRGRMNHWRRSPSRGRGGGGGGGGRFDRRFSPQRRYSRERLSPMQNQFRKFSPPRRFSPAPQYQRRSRDYRPNSRDRRPSSPYRNSSRERGNNFNRWDQPNKMSQRPKQKRSSSESSNWEANDNVGDLPPNASTHRGSIGRVSPARNNGRRDRSVSRSLERHNRESGSGMDRGNKGRRSTGRSSVEYCAPAMKTIDLCHDDRTEKSDAVHKTRVDSASHVQSSKHVSQIAPKQSESQRGRFSVSLSRTPSPFLKLHEREKAQKAATAAAATALTAVNKKTLDKKSSSSVAVGPASVSKRGRKDSDSSSTDSSADSDESDDDEEQTKKPKLTALGKKPEGRVHSRKYKSSSSDNDSEDESSDEKMRRAPQVKNAAKNRVNVSSASKSSRVERSADIEKRREKAAPPQNVDKHKNSTEFREPAEIVKKDVTSSASSNKKTVPVIERKRSADSGSAVVGGGDIQIVDKIAESRTKKATSRKRTLSSSGLKKQQQQQQQQQRDSSDSEEERVAKKKRKKSKKSSSKRNSDDGSSSDSDVEASSRKKKHKKHKKHSKKSKKHKKHKKRSKKAESSSSSADDASDDSHEQPVKIKTAAVLQLGSGVNEDLEKQLRERALKSMKKIE